MTKDKQIYKRAREFADCMSWQEIFNGVDSLMDVAKDVHTLHEEEEIEYFNETVADRVCEG